MTFAEEILKHRQRLGLNQAEASALLGVSKRTYEYWESIQRTPLEITQEGVLARFEKAKPKKSKTA